MSLSEALKRIIENPEDLTELPQLIEQVGALESEVDGYQSRIVEMRELNKKYLAMVPIAGETPEPDTEEQEVTFEDAQEQLMNAFHSVGGN